MNRQFGALSGIAIILVVLNHSIHMGMLAPSQVGLPPVTGISSFILLALQQLGTYAVPTFLFISGCFVVYVAQSGTLAQSYKATWARLQHIFWPYALWSVVFYVVIYFQMGERYTFLGYVKNLLVGYPFNFVPLLVLYYVLSPLLVRAGKRYAALLVVAIGVYQLFLVNALRPGTLGFSFPDWTNFLVPRVVSTTLADWAIYFPLGIVYSLYSKTLLPLLRRWRWPIIAVCATLLVLRVLDATNVMNAPFAAAIAPLPLIGLLPLIKRDSIPFIATLEWVGRMSYGLYLTNLIVADVCTWLLQALWPQLLGFQAVLEPLLFIATLGIPLLVMRLLSKLPIRVAYRYMFG